MLKGTVTENISVSTNSSSGPSKMVLDKNTHGYYYVSSTKIDTITTHSIAIKYDTGESEIKGNENKFIKLFKDNKEAKSDLKP